VPLAGIIRMLYDAEVIPGVLSLSQSHEIICRNFPPQVINREFGFYSDQIYQVFYNYNSHAPFRQLDNDGGAHLYEFKLIMARLAIEVAPKDLLSKGDCSAAL
jgi:hypothetical protein